MADTQQNKQKPLVSVAAAQECNVPHSADDPLPTDNNVNGTKNNNGIPPITSSSPNTEQVRIDEDTEAYFKSFPPGYRFCPSDNELIVHYLNKKIKNEKLPRHKIHEVNLYKYSPEKISEIYPVLGEKEWYFFTPRDRKYSNGTRPNRAAGTGYWKATGADKAIRNHKGFTIGFRKALVFYEGKPPKGEKTSWIMHEYRVNAQPRKKSCATDMRLDDYVLCRIYKKTDKSFKSRQKNEDDHNNNLYSDPRVQQIVQSQRVEEENVQSQSDSHSHSHYEKMDDHMQEEEYRDYPQPVLPNEVLEIPHLQCDVPNISSGNGNLFHSFDYGLGQIPVCSLPASSVSPTGNKWDSKLKVLPIPPVYSTTSSILGADYFKEGWWDFKPQGIQEQIWDKTQKDFLPLDYDIHSISFLDSEVNLDTILNNNPSSSSFDSPSMPKSERE